MMMYEAIYELRIDLGLDIESILDKKEERLFGCYAAEIKALRERTSRPRRLIGTII